MKRTPIIAPAQVYLHNEHNEYVVVTKVNRGDIQFRGNGFYGMNESELFLERFSPVDPADLTTDETNELTMFLASPQPLLVGWVTPDDDEDDFED
jgi:succinate dehydrogenase flavin-adding protein (antitoxin of CptAB toxin-antitoxin module)